MLGLRRIAAARPDLVLEDGHLLIRPPQLADYPQWSTLRAESQTFLQPWEPAWPHDDLTREAYRRRIKRYIREIEQDEGYPFFIFRASDRVLLGGLNLTNIRRGAASMAALGYWMGAPYAGQGIMTAAVRTVTAFAASTVSLRRIEAACVPENTRSMHLLEKAGFTKEGYAREFLLINGQWRDHVLYARLANDAALERTVLKQGRTKS